MPSTLAPATYTLFACADDTRVVAEENEANNCTAAASLVTVSLADLVENAVSNPPSSAAPGTSCSVTDTVHNPSSLAVAASVSRFYLSNDDVRNPGDVFVDRRTQRRWLGVREFIDR